jgi:hypothetical protein
MSVLRESLLPIEGLRWRVRVARPVGRATAASRRARLPPDVCGDSITEGARKVGRCGAGAPLRNAGGGACGERR